MGSKAAAMTSQVHHGGVRVVRMTSTMAKFAGRQLQSGERSSSEARSLRERSARLPTSINGQPWIRALLRDACLESGPRNFLEQRRSLTSSRLSPRFECRSSLTVLLYQLTFSFWRLFPATTGEDGLSQPRGACG